MEAFVQTSVMGSQDETETLRSQKSLLLSRKKILVVDDDPDMRLSLHIRLKANSFDVVFAADGVTAIAAARKHMPSLVILDLGLPAGDGFTVMERLRQSDDLSLIPVIVVSARERNVNRGRSLKAGAKAFLQKPVDNTHLLSVIRQVLGESGGSSPVVYDLGNCDQNN